MKAIFHYRAHPNFAEIHFSRELPVFPRHQRHHRLPFPKVMLSRSADLEAAAELLALVNVGKFCVEMEDRRPAFREFLDNIVLLEGVEMIVDAERYTLNVKIGRCFDGESVCRSVARCVHRHFYSSEQLVCESRLTSEATTTPVDGIQTAREKQDIDNVP